MLKKSICPLFVKKGPKNTSPVAFLPHNNQKKKKEPRSFFTTMTIKHALQKNKPNKTINKDSNPKKSPPGLLQPANLCSHPARTTFKHLGTDVWVWNPRGHVGAFAATCHGIATSAVLPFETLRDLGGLDWSEALVLEMLEIIQRMVPWFGNLLPGPFLPQFHGAVKNGSGSKNR